MKTPDALVLAFDIGTSSLRTALFTGPGERLVETTAQATYRLNYTADGGAELSPVLLRRAARACLAKTLGGARRGVPILGVGTSCFWHSLIGLGGQGQPLTPVHTWADSRCRSDAAALRQKLDEREVHARTGCMLRSSFWPAKLRWLQRRDPKLFSQVRVWMSPAEWLCKEFLGAVNCGLSMASGTGLLNAHTLDWDDAMLDLCGISRERLNALDETAISSAAGSQASHLLKGVPWFPALGDGAASNLGCGATRPGYGAINVGTSAALRVMRAAGKTEAPFGLFCYRVDGERFIIGGAVSNAGNLRAWCLRELRLDEATLERTLARRSVPAHGLTVEPLWTAERAPDWPEDRFGSIRGITQHTTAVDILQAATEASYYRIANIADLVLKQETIPPRFILSGGLQRSRSSLQRLADILNQPIYPSEEPEASLQGAAVYVLERARRPPAMPKLSKPILPRPQTAEVYAQERAKLRN